MADRHIFLTEGQCKALEVIYNPIDGAAFAYHVARAGRCAMSWQIVAHEVRLRPGTEWMDDVHPDVMVRAIDAVGAGKPKAGGKTWWRNVRLRHAVRTLMAHDGMSQQQAAKWVAAHSNLVRRARPVTASTVWKAVAGVVKET